MIEILPAQWAQPLPVYAGTTTLRGGVSSGNCLNLAYHADDEETFVQENRRRFQTWLETDVAIHAPKILWLNQIHSAHAIDEQEYYPGISADACIVRSAGQVAVVMTADCVPVLLCAADGQVCAAVHAGWKGALAGVLGHAVAKMGVDPVTLYAWIAPCISQRNYQVDDSFRECFIECDPDFAAVFVSEGNHKYRADLQGMVRMILQKNGVPAAHITASPYCTFDNHVLASYRRDGAKSFRIASFITRLSHSF